MAALNCCHLIGNVTRDPQLKFLPGGGAVAEFGLAITEKFISNGERKESTVFVDVATFGKRAETIQQYVHKGDPIYIGGRLKLDQWDDKATGAKRSKISVVAEEFQFLGGRDKGSGQAGRPELRSGGTAQREEQPAPPDDPPLIDQEDIPF